MLLVISAAGYAASLIGFLLMVVVVVVVSVHKQSINQSTASSLQSCCSFNVKFLKWLYSVVASLVSCVTAMLGKKCNQYTLVRVIFRAQAGPV